MFTIRQVTRLAVGAALLMTGCGQVPASTPLAGSQGKAVASESTIRETQEAIARSIKAQLERTYPDNLFRFQDLSVSALPNQNVHTFRGIARLGTKLGTSTWTVYGRYDLTTRKATIAHKVLLKSTRFFPAIEAQAQAAGDEVLDLSADAPSVQQAKQDIKDQIEVAGVRPGSYSVVSGIKVETLDPTFPTRSFTAHERQVGHGWEVRYALKGTYEPATRKATVLSRDRLSGNQPRWPIGF